MNLLILAARVAAALIVAAVFIACALSYFDVLVQS